MSTVRLPVTHTELANLPDGATLTLLEICNRNGVRGVIPFGKTKMWALIQSGLLPPGKAKVGDNRPNPPRVWTAREVRAMVDAYEIGTLGVEPVDSGVAA